MSSTLNVNRGRARASAVSRGILVATLATTSQIADAQSAPEASASQQPALEEIVVTAQFRSQSVQDTPLSVTAIDARMLEARGQSEVTQIAEQAPNVTLVQGGGIFGPSIGAQIRGIGQFDSSPAYEPGVGMYVDDVYIATLSGAMLDLLDLERIEVLRGPQGTLTGRNSIGGAVKLFSRKPDGNDDGYVDPGIGSRDRLSARGSLGFKALGRSRILVQMVRHEDKEGGPVQLWGAGLYENEYIRVDGRWMFRKLNLSIYWATSFDEGWAMMKEAPAHAPELFPKNPLGPDRLVDHGAAVWPASTQTFPFHFAHPTTGRAITDRLPAGQDRLPDLS